MLQATQRGSYLPQRKDTFETNSTSKAELLNPQRPNNTVKWVGVALIVAGGAVVFFGIIACLGSNEIIAVGALASIGTGGSYGIIGGGIFLIIIAGVLLATRSCCNQNDQKRMPYKENLQQKEEPDNRSSEHHSHKGQALRSSSRKKREVEKSRKNPRKPASTPKNTRNDGHSSKLSERRSQPPKSPLPPVIAFQPEAIQKARDEPAESTTKPQGKGETVPAAVAKPALTKKEEPVKPLSSIQRKNDDLICQFFDQFSKWNRVRLRCSESFRKSKELLSRVGRDKLPEEVKSYNLKLNEALQANAAASIDTYLKIYDLFIAFGRTKRDNYAVLIDLDEMAEALEMSPDHLRHLFEMFGLPETSQRDLGCLNVFFATIPDMIGQYGLGGEASQVDDAYGFKQSFSWGHPLWPESKIPLLYNDNSRVLTLNEFAQFLHVSPEDCRALARSASVAFFDEQFSSFQMRVFCEHYSKERNYPKLVAKQKIPAIKRVFCATARSKYVSSDQSMQLAVRLSDWVLKRRSGNQAS